MFKKIEVWVLYLTLLLGFVLLIFFGSLIRREALGGGRYIPVITQLSKLVYFLSEIPFNLKKIQSSDIKNPNMLKDRFKKTYGFSGEKLDEDFLLLLSRYDGDINQSKVELVSLQNFEVIHTWIPDINSILSNVKIKKGGKWEHLMRDRHEKRFRIMSPLLFSDGSIVFQHNDSPLIKIDKNSKLVWLKTDHMYHHTQELDSEGNIWACSKNYPYSLKEQYVGEKFGNFNEDAMTKLSPEGKVLFHKSIPELLMENEMEYLLFSIGDHRFTKDPIHLNDIQPVNINSNYWEIGDVFLSLAHQSMILLYRPRTNEILWKSTGKFYHQHDVDVLDDHRISIFNNNRKFLFNKDIVDGNNEIIIYDFKNQEYSLYFDKYIKKHDIRTISEGNCEIFPNGEIFIEESNYGRLLYFNRNGDLKWSHINRSKKDNNIYSQNWSRILHGRDNVKMVKTFLNFK